MYNGIDISRWQGVINFNQVKASGVDFAIIKAGGSDKGLYKDSKFETYYASCKNLGIKTGSYYFVGPDCISAADGIADAERFLNIIKGKSFEYPVYIDIETTPKTAKKGATDAVIAFCETLENNGYYAGIYASDISGFHDALQLERLEKFDKWVARYGKSPQYVPVFGMWQYSSKGSVPGIIGHVDMDISYIDYDKIMKSKHLNGF